MEYNHLAKLHYCKLFTAFKTIIFKPVDSQPSIYCVWPSKHKLNMELFKIDFYVRFFFYEIIFTNKYCITTFLFNRARNNKFIGAL